MMKASHITLIPLLSLFSAVALPQGHAQLILVEDFNDAAVGNILNDPNWTAGSGFGSASGSFNVVDTPPASGSDHALSNANAQNSGVSTSLGAVIGDSSDTVGTLYFTFNLTSATLPTTGVSIGLTTNTPNAGFDSFRSQLALNASGSNFFSIRDGGTSKFADNVTIETGTWYSVWVVVDNSTNTWSAYVQGGAIAEATQLTSGGDGEFAFRNTSSGVINTLAVARGAGTNNTVLMDNFYFGLGNLAGEPVPEPGSALLLCAGTACLFFRRTRN